MSQSATPATQNDMTTSSDTSKKTRFCDFSHRHGNFSLTTVLHLTHVECHKVPRLPRKTTEAHLLTPRKSDVFQCFPWARHLPHFAASKSTFSYEFSYGPTAKSTFRASLPSIFMTCHKMPRLPRNLHLVTTSRSADNAIRRKHATQQV